MIDFVKGMRGKKDEDERSWTVEFGGKIGGRKLRLVEGLETFLR
jgi:hypothetical protein